MDNNWNLFIDLEKEKEKEKENNVKSIKKNGKITFHYTKDEIKEEEMDFFKKSPIKEKNIYINSFNHYKLTVKK